MSFKKIQALLLKPKIQILLIILLTALTYSNILQNKFLGDDPAFIEDWPQIRSLNNLPTLFKGQLPANQAGVYRPIRSGLYAFYYQISGTNPYLYHLHSIIVHLAATVLVYLIISLLVKKRMVAFLAGLMFGLHPVHTEAVTYVSASMDTMGIMLMLTSFYFYLKYDCLGKAVSNYLLSIFFALIAFFSNEMSLILPALLILYQVCFKSNLKKITTFTTFGFYFFLAAFYFFVRLFLVQVSFSRGDYIAKSFYHTMLVMPQIFLKYVYLLIFPLKLSFIHTIADGFETYMMPYSNFNSILSKSLFNFDIFVPIILLIAILCGGVFFFKKNPLVSFCVGWFFIAMLPVSYIFPVGPALSERYLYLSSIGYILLVATLIDKLYHLKAKSNWPKIVAILLTVLLLIFYFFRTYIRNQDYQTPIIFWSSVIREYPKSLIGHYNLSLYLANSDPDKAIKEYQTIVQIEPKFWEARFNLANGYLRLNKLDLAETEYKSVLQSNPDFLDAYLDLASIYANQKRYDLALQQLSRGLKIDLKGYKVFNTVKNPEQVSLGFTKLYTIMGNIYLAQKKVDLASQSFARALQFEPDEVATRQVLKNLLTNYPAIINSRLIPLPNSETLVYFSNQDLIFSYPKDWSITNQAGADIVQDSSSNFTIEIRTDLKDSNKSVDLYLKKQQDSYGKLIQEGLAQVPNVDSAYVKVWNDKGIKKLQFFLFKDTKVIKILVYPADSVLMKNFEDILKSIVIL